MIMLKPLLWLDIFILSKVEHSMHLLQRLTGKTTCYVLSRFKLLECGLVLLILWQSMWTGVLENNFIISGYVYFLARKYPFIFCAFFALDLFWGMYFWRTMEEESYQRVASGLANPKKISRKYIFTRILGLWFFVGYWVLGISKREFLVAWPWFVLLAFYLIGLYIDCCDPLPPCRGRIGDWLDSLNHKPVLAKNEN